jgi:hypothetical protein
LKAVDEFVSTGRIYQLFDEALVSVSFWKANFSAWYQVCFARGNKPSFLRLFPCNKPSFQNYSFTFLQLLFHEFLAVSNFLTQNKTFRLASCRPRHQLLSVCCKLSASPMPRPMSAVWCRQFFSAVSPLSAATKMLFACRLPGTSV